MSVSSLKGGIEEARSLVDGIWFILWGYGLEEGMIEEVVIEELDNGMSVSILKGGIEEARS